MQWVPLSVTRPALKPLVLLLEGKGDCNVRLAGYAAQVSVRVAAPAAACAADGGARCRQTFPVGGIGSHCGGGSPAGPTEQIGNKTVTF